MGVIKRISEGIKPWQVIGSFLVFVVGTGYGMYKFAEAKGYDKAKEDVKEISYEGKIDKLIVSFDSLKKYTIVSIDTLKDNQFKMMSKQEDIKGAVNGLRGVVLDHVAKDKGMTIDQFKQYMEAAPEVKKNSMKGSTQ